MPKCHTEFADPCLSTFALMAHWLGLSYKLMRGGSWNNNASNCRSSNRIRNNARNINNNVGFRVVVFSPL